ncbi:NUDIX domain-containing protein [Rathayibacter sp. CAU 1779]
MGGGVEPGETPQQSVIREVGEELGVVPTIVGIVGAYGGPLLETTLPNGDHVAYVTVAFECGIPSAGFTLEGAELIETAWFAREQVARLDRHAWIDSVLDDAAH